MSKFFIAKPNFAWVIAIFISLAGLLVLPNQPVSHFPEVAPSQISLSAAYPGAPAPGPSESVTSVPEEALSGVKCMLYFESTSTNGAAGISVTFAPGVDPALAQADVQNRLKKAEGCLPVAVM